MRWLLASLGFSFMVLLVGCGGEAVPPVVTAPTNVEAVGANGVMTITWQYGGKAPTGFEVKRSISGSDESELLATVDPSARSHVDRTPEYDVSYTYTVLAVFDEESHASVPSSSATVEEGVALSVGTYRWMTNPTAFTSAGFYLFLDPNNVTESSFTLRLYGPTGWNNDQPYERTYQATWLNTSLPIHVNVASAEAVVGDYELLVFDSTGTQELYSATATLADLVMLPPLDPNVTLTSSEISASWVDVTTDATYQVNLYRGLYDSILNQWYTYDASFSMDGLALAPDDYAVTVYGAAYEWFAPGRVIVPARHDAVGHLSWTLTVE